MNTQLNLEIGRQIFHIACTKRMDAFVTSIRKDWSDYVVDTTYGGCRVEMVPYSQNRHFNWAHTELERFRAFFLNTHRRFPADEQIGRSIGESIRLLQHLDPEGEGISHIRARIGKTQFLIYARGGLSLFFFDTELNIAFFFLSRNTVLFSVLMWILNGFKVVHPALSQGYINGMMFILSHLLIQNNGLLLHGSAIQKDGQGVLFLGPSGSGKSTATRLCRPDVCFSDDGVIIIKEGAQVFAYRSPFRQIHKTLDKSTIMKGEIHKVFLLKKNRQHRVSSIRNSELMCVILMNLIHFFKYLSDETAKAGFHLTKEILDTLPSYRLEFARTEELWNNIV
ncbi:MAG: hypothetical protein JW896_10305 [Deltaproteobacteria bacterium]|nr:hypothetical protein [Deltaproteobacteria bacterium]